MAYEYSTLKIEQRERGVWILTINRPEALNALNSTVLTEMSDFFRQLNEIDFESSRALVITGAGEKAFVAGADIKEMSDMSPEAALAFAERGQMIFHELSLLKIPVIAAVNGFALGGGFELALACDFIIASENAKFGLPEVSLGLIPGFGGTQRLTGAVGIRKARELIFTGNMLTATEAKTLGVTIDVVPQAALLTTALKSVETILSRAPLAVAEAKKSIVEGQDLAVTDGLKLEAQCFSHLFSSADTREGLSAFTEKRKPNFVGN